MWILLVIIIFVIGILVVGHYATFTKLDKETIEGAGGLKHISGVPGISQGVECFIRVGKERIIINDLLIIPIERVISSEIVRNRDLVERDGNIVGGAITGGILFGGVGAILGGMSKAGKSVATEDVILLIINYKNINGEDSQIALMATGPLTKQLTRDVSKVINKIVGYVPETSPDEMYEI